MKNLSLILNVVLLIAVAVLYFLHFSSTATDEEATTAVAGSSLPVNIAYINSDTLLKNYDYFKKASEELEAKSIDLQAEYENRARGLQTEINSFQQNAQNMTMAQAQAVQENLVKKQENLLRYQQTLTQSLQQEEAKVNNELYDRVSDYLKEYGRAQDFQIVLTYQKGSGVLYANDSLNITTDVLTGLNAVYQEALATDTTAVE